MGIEIIEKYFTELNEDQIQKYKTLFPLYSDWNSKINVISRKDIDKLYLHHVLHSLAIAKYISFPDHAKVLDLGTGGGFPGIPLAIMFPNVHFTLCDSIRKKIKVATEVKDALTLGNVETIVSRAEELSGSYDYIVSRAVSDLRNLVPWTKHLGAKEVICLKGGDVLKEMSESAKLLNIKINRFKAINISDWFDEEYFVEKKIVILRK